MQKGDTEIEGMEPASSSSASSESSSSSPAPSVPLSSSTAPSVPLSSSTASLDQNNDPSVKRFVYSICSAPNFKKSRRKNLAPQKVTLAQFEDENCREEAQALEDGSFDIAAESQNFVPELHGLPQSLNQHLKTATNFFNSGASSSRTHGLQTFLEQGHAEQCNSIVIPKAEPLDLSDMYHKPDGENMSNSSDHDTMGTGNDEETEDVEEEMGEGEQRPYKCDICGRGFMTSKYRSAHKKTHDLDRPFECEHCGMRFHQRQNLVTHVYTHTGEKPHVCEVCGRGFRQSSTLARHRRKHTGERPHVCGFCGQAFTLRHVMLQHERIHTGEKPYECTECGKDFKEQHNLKRHLRWHRGEKPFACSVCDSKFSQKNHMLRHEKTHIPKKHTIY